MKSLFSIRLGQIVWFAVFFGMMWSCQPENTNSAMKQVQLQKQANTTAQNNSLIVATTQDVVNITSSAMTGNGFIGGRVVPGGRVQEHGTGECRPIITGNFKIDTSHPDTVMYSGRFTVDFGDGSGCSDSTELRKGKIIDAFLLVASTHRDGFYSLTDSMTFEGFQKDTVKVDGLFVRKVSKSRTFTVDITGAKLTYPDGTSMTWDGSLHTQLGPLVPTTVPMPADSMAHGTEHSFEWAVTGYIQGTTREGISFKDEITKELIYESSCSPRIPVSGTITMTIGGAVSIVDYGDGTCDFKYTITADGITTEYTMWDFDRNLNHGTITSADLTMCPSPCCGGYFIVIGGKTYEFGALPPSSGIDLTKEKLPFRVSLHWTLITGSCDNRRITIQDISRL
jgi:hypothetical protein